MTDLCTCGSLLPTDECHAALDAQRYNNSSGEVTFDVGDWPPEVRRSFAATARRLGYQTGVRGDSLLTSEVNLKPLFSHVPIAGPGGFGPAGEAALASRSKWLTQGFEEEDPSLRESMTASLSRLETAPADSIEDVRRYSEFVGGIDDSALSNDAAVLSRVVELFLMRFPDGSVDLLSNNERSFAVRTYNESLNATSVVLPSDFLRQARGADRRAPLDPADILEALIERSGPEFREGFAVKRPDSSLFFGLGSRLEFPDFGTLGAHRPRGLAFQSLRSNADDPRVLVTFGSVIRRQYIVSALHQVQIALFNLFDPLHFSADGRLDTARWNGTIRTVQRIVELTYLVQTTADPDARRELFLSLLDLYDGFQMTGNDLLPPVRWFERGRSWLPEALRDSEDSRLRKVRTAVIDEIWSGLLFGRHGDLVEVPGLPQRLSKEAYCQRFLRAFRNALTHGYQPGSREPTMLSVLVVHSGHFPQALPQMAVPLLEAFLGNAPAWLSRGGR